ncbi:MAG: OFA family MFS transporter [Puniceicoccales bacterium]|nr:OFA family MFS transporter [Puniceicoccales bacterium]
MSSPYPNAERWPVAIAGVVLQVCLGTVYAWSFFQKPITEAYGWSNESVTWVFSLAICFLGLAAAFGGIQLSRGKASPRTLALTGTVLFAVGHFIGALALWKSQLWLLWLGYGVIGGMGLGLGYVVPVATAAKWFPDKKGFITGMVVMGFGFGALLMSKVLAPLAMQIFAGNLALVFAGLGIVFAVAAPFAALFMKNPPDQTPRQESVATPADQDTGKIAWKSFVLLWLLFFCNIFVGIAIISFQSPLLQDLLQQKNAAITPAELAAHGATLIAISAIFNGLGRFMWGAVSDRIGQSLAFSLLMGTQFFAFGLLLVTRNPLFFGILVCYVLLCYGGGFGTIPSYISAIFGARRMAFLYGIILTAWSAAGIAGPKFMAWLRDTHSSDTAVQYAFGFSAVLLLIGLAFSFLPAIRTRK